MGYLKGLGAGDPTTIATTYELVLFKQRHLKATEAAPSQALHDLV
jgi:hypothetical protein